MMSSQFSKTLHTIYGRNFNPQRFERGSKRGRGLYFWGMILLLGAIAAALGVVIYLFVRPPSGFTGEKVGLELLGNKQPETAAPVEYIVNIKNGEDSDLSDGQIFLGWSGSSSSQSPRVEILAAAGQEVANDQNTWPVGALPKGGETRFNFTAVFFGKEGESVSLPLRLSFRSPGLGTIFTKEISQEFVLGKSKIEFSLSGPDNASAGSEIALALSLSPAAAESYPQSWLELNYPGNFSVISEDPKKTDNGWPIGSLASVDGNLAVLIRGRLDGNSGDEIQFTASLFSDKGKGEVLSAPKTIKLQNAALDLSLAAAPASGQKLQWGERLDYRVTLKNSSAVDINDLVVSVSISGEELIRPGSIAPKNGGFYESGNMIWDKNSTPSLSVLPGGGSRNLSFSLETLSAVPADFSGTPAILAKARLKGRLNQEDALAESGEILTKVLANAEFDSAAQAKAGPNPPLPGQTTSYTVTWKIGPTSGALRDLQISAKLPSYVGWADKTDLQVGEFSFDSAARVVTWRSSRVPRLNEAVLVSFDINLVPENETSNALIILGQSNFKATDDAAAESMELINFPLTLGTAR